MQYDNPVSSSDLLATLTADSANLSDSTIAAINSLLNLDNVDTVDVAGITGTTVQLPQSGTASAVHGTVAGVKGDTVVVDLAAAEAAGASVYHLQSDANLVVNLEGQAAAGAADVQLFAALAVDTSAIDLVVTTGNGDDVITVKGDQNTLIDAGDGNDTIVTGNGDNVVIAGAGNNNVTTGSGNDTVILSGSNHADIVNTGAGYDVVQLDGSAEDYDFAVGNNFTVNLTGNQTAAISNAEFLSFANGDTVALAHSDDEAAALRLYQGILGRDADLDGAKAFVEAVNAGTSLNDIANTFLNSDEFGGANNAADINELYKALLGRDAEEGGSAVWQEVLANGGSLADIAAAIAVSAEAQELDASNATFVNDLYVNVLGRDAEEAGLNNWVDALFNGASRAEVAQAIVGSSEASDKANSDFVDALYQSALGRTADEAGKAAWTEALAAGVSHADVALGIVGSAEAIDHIDNVVVLHGQV
ncbi:MULTISPECIES: DUF4214 domain-containing protein [Pseudomonas]|jgi:Domain of unknown function (DUF4214)/RTX calcium-binding nonapeptide repeat (4 copies)|uniref:DUF4214 domain-containing protein n=2 Tax=Pseudomonas TaxID=286 RepID=A0A1L7N9E6_PSEPU|nr:MULTISPECIES: DUF4214 domain-containing protein [Pseudomonas]ERT18517.1 hemolysin [Pseudomonas putida SJ3]PTC00993.1 DUF4214 domain-containing protein [Thalassospira xiamenensis]AGN81456.1 hemolysin-type calcium-binding region [Pseudomonas putida H8234]EKT4452350.1 DUF4214 domain-containing protein [Pseudomonas putida]MBH3451720.1 DUF4214 domain-containing protein [Pseudomonas putida]